MSTPRERMIEGAARLLAKQGLQATSFSEVLDLTGAPRGSIYHHFPEGKNQLINSAVELVGTRAREILDSRAGASAEVITATFLDMWRTLLVRSHLEAGCAVVAVTVAAGSPDLLRHAGVVFRSWRERLAELLRQGGLTPTDAVHFAALLVASSEGAVVLCRAEQSMEPFDLVSAQVLEQVRRMMAR